MKLIKHNDSLQCDSIIAQYVTQSFGNLTFSCDKPDESLSDKPFLNWQSLLPAQRKPEVRICVVLSDCQNYWELAAVRSMITSLQGGFEKTHNFHYTILSAQSSHYYLQDGVLDYLYSQEGEYNACVTFAPWVATLIKDELPADVPLIFGGIAHPDRVGLVENSEYGSGHTIGAVMGVESYDEQVKTIRELKPSLKRLVVPYDSSLTHGGLTERYYGPTQALCHSWRDHGGRVSVVEVQAGNNMGDIIARAAGRDGLVNLSVQSSIMIQTKNIIEACSKKGAPVYAHSKQGVRAGAVLGSGNSGSEYGPAVAYCIVKTIIQGYDPLALKMIRVKESSDLCYFEPQLVGQGFGYLQQETLRKMRMLPIDKVE